MIISKINRKIFLVYIVVIIISSLFFMPFKYYGIVKTANNYGETIEPKENKLYLHIYNLPFEKYTEMADKDSLNTYLVEIKYDIIYFEILSRYSVITILFMLIYFFYNSTEKGIKRIFPTNIVCFVGSIALFAAILSMPYPYYNFLKVFISIISIYGIALNFKTSTLITALFIITLTVFNPVWQIAFNESIWKTLDFAFGAILLYLSYAPKGYKD